MSYVADLSMICNQSVEMSLLGRGPRCTRAGRTCPSPCLGDCLAFAKCAAFAIVGEYYNKAVRGAAPETRATSALETVANIGIGLDKRTGTAPARSRHLPSNRLQEGRLQ